MLLGGIFTQWAASRVWLWQYDQWTALDRDGDYITYVDPDEVRGFDQQVVYLGHKKGD